jgi:hypothetical protein
VVDLESLDEPLDVTGTVSLGSAQLVFSPSRFVVGRSHVAIRNDGVDPIVGTFAGLPEGSTTKTTDGRFDFRVSYVGGDGNDVTLTTERGPAVRGDFDRDGKADLMWQHRGGNGNEALGFVHRMSLDGLAIRDQQTVYVETNMAWHVAAKGDFDANGVTDLVWRNTVTGEIYVMLLGADGRPIEGRVIYREPDPEWKIAGAPDVDGDGRADILWWNRNARYEMFYLQLMDGTTIRQQDFAGNGFTTPTAAVMVGDFDGDSRSDVLFRLDSGDLVVRNFYYYNNQRWLTGNPGFLHRETNPDWKVVATPDLDGNGTSDVVWHNRTNGVVYAMLVRGTTYQYFEAFAQGVVHQAPGPEWVIADSGDFDGDGKEDIAWHNEADGRVHLMLMDGLAIKDQRTIYREPDLGWKILGP